MHVQVAPATDPEERKREIQLVLDALFETDWPARFEAACVGRTASVRSAAAAWLGISAEPVLVQEAFKPLVFELYAFEQSILSGAIYGSDSSCALCRNEQCAEKPSWWFWKNPDGTRRSFLAHGDCNARIAERSAWSLPAAVAIVRARQRRLDKATTYRMAYGGRVDQPVVQVLPAPVPIAAGQKCTTTASFGPPAPEARRVEPESIETSIAAAASAQPVDPYMAQRALEAAPGFLEKVWADRLNYEARMAGWLRDRQEDVATEREEQAKRRHRLRMLGLQPVRDPLRSRAFGSFGLDPRDR